MGNYFRGQLIVYVRIDDSSHARLLPSSSTMFFSREEEDEEETKGQETTFINLAEEIALCLLFLFKFFLFSLFFCRMNFYPHLFRNLFSALLHTLGQAQNAEKNLKKRKMN